LEDIFCDVGAPFEMKSDNAPEFKGKHWLSILWHAIVASSFTEPMHPNQNLAECHCGSLKAALDLVHLTWCSFNLFVLCFGVCQLCSTTLGKAQSGLEITI